MDSNIIRTLVRDVLSEEIAKLKRDGAGRETGAAPRPKTHEEIVSIRSDAELMQFVRRLAEILKDGRSREEIESGRRVFRLGTGAGANSAAGTSHLPSGAMVSPAAPAPSIARIEQGIVSERQIEVLAPGTTKLVVGKAVRFTPLARDRLRLRGIEIERAV